LQEREGFRPERQLRTVRAEQGAPIGIEREALEALGRAPRLLGVHPPELPSTDHFAPDLSKLSGEFRLPFRPSEAQRCSILPDEIDHERTS